jgi:hypothetical protein
MSDLELTQKSVQERSKAENMNEEKTKKSTKLYSCEASQIDN